MINIKLCVLVIFYCNTSEYTETSFETLNDDAPSHADNYNNANCKATMAREQTSRNFRVIHSVCQIQCALLCPNKKELYPNPCCDIHHTSAGIVCYACRR